jgi:uncharacterized protein YecE (DUF72 family)
MSARRRRGDAWVGTSGWIYPSWRGVFYPRRLPQRRWLEYASRCFGSIELNGTFYSLKSPPAYRRWVAETPDDFVFAVKGSRFITHNLKLRRIAAALGNFYASGILALGVKTGPFLWQLPATYALDLGRLRSFIAALPRSSREAEAVARGHDARLRRGALVEAVAEVPYRHAFEVRHPSYFQEEFYALLRESGCGWVIGDTAGRHPYAEEVTAGFVYVRLHGSRELYASRYEDDELASWARKLERWRRQGRDVYVYFDNDAKVHAPRDALRLAERLGLPAEPPQLEELEERRGRAPSHPPDGRRPASRPRS